MRINKSVNAITFKRPYFCWQRLVCACKWQVFLYCFMNWFIWDTEGTHTPMDLLTLFTRYTHTALTRKCFVFTKTFISTEGPYTWHTHHILLYFMINKVIPQNRIFNHLHLIKFLYLRSSSIFSYWRFIYIVYLCLNLCLYTFVQHHLLIPLFSFRPLSYGSFSINPFEIQPSSILPIYV